MGCTETRGMQRTNQETNAIGRLRCVSVAARTAVVPPTPTHTCTFHAILAENSINCAAAKQKLKIHKIIIKSGCDISLVFRAQARTRILVVLFFCHFIFKRSLPNTTYYYYLTTKSNMHKLLLFSFLISLVYCQYYGGTAPPIHNFDLVVAPVGFFFLWFFAVSLIIQHFFFVG